MGGRRWMDGETGPMMNGGDGGQIDKEGKMMDK